MPTTKAYFRNVPLINRENLTDTWAKGAIDKAFSLFCKHGTCNEQIAAASALSTIALSDKKLSLNILFPEMDQPETLDLADDMKQKAGIGNSPGNCFCQMIETSGQETSPVKPSMYALTNRFHFYPLLKRCLDLLKAIVRFPPG